MPYVDPVPFITYQMAATGKPFGVDHQLLDDRPPFLDIGLLPCAEALGGSRARKDLRPEIGKPGPYRRIGQCFVERQSWEEFARVLPPRQRCGERQRGRIQQHGHHPG
jgi:hypothetical protein